MIGAKQKFADIKVNIFLQNSLIEGNYNQVTDLDPKERFIMDVEVPDHFTCEDLLKAGLDHFNEVLLLEEKVFRLPIES